MPVKKVVGVRRYLVSDQINRSFFGRFAICVLSVLYRLSQQILFRRASSPLYSRSLALETWLLIRGILRLPRKCGIHFILQPASEFPAFP